jgi:RNA polymerase sigma-70 factor, ECF subfamily
LVTPEPDERHLGGVAITAADPALRIERLVAAHQKDVWRYLRFLGATTAQADDLTQETFLEVWRKPFEEFSDRASGSYLRTVARHRFLMLIRSEGRRPEIADLNAADSAWERHAGDDGGDSRVDALRLCLETLKEQARRAIDLLYGVERKSRSEVAEQLELKVEGLKTLVRRSKVKLRECVERRLDQEDRE